MKKFLLPLVATSALLFTVLSLAQGEPTWREIYDLAKSGQLAKAKQLAHEAVKNHPKSAKAHYLLADLESRGGNVGLARDALATAESLAPGLPFVDQGFVLVLRGRLESQGASRSPATPAQTAGNSPDRTYRMLPSRECLSEIDLFRGIRGASFINSPERVRAYLDAAATKSELCAAMWFRQSLRISTSNTACMIKTKERDQYGNFLGVDDSKKAAAVAACIEEVTTQDILDLNKSVKEVLASLSHDEEKRLQVVQTRKAEQALQAERVQNLRAERERDVAQNPKNYERVETRYIARGTLRCTRSMEGRLPSVESSQTIPNGCGIQREDERITSIFDKSKQAGWSGVFTPDNQLTYVQTDGIKTRVSMETKQEPPVASSPLMCATLEQRCAEKDPGSRSACWVAAKRIHGCQ